MNKVLRIILASILLLYIVFSSIIHGQQEKGNTICEDILINFSYPSTDRFLNEASVRELIKDSLKTELIGSQWNDINTERIKEIIAAHPAVKNVLICSTPSKKLKIEIERRKALVRVITSHKNMYLSCDNHIVPAQHTNPCHRPVISCISIDSASLHGPIYELASLVCNDPVLQTQLQQIAIDKEQNITFIPRLGNYTIRFGKPHNIANKVKRIKSIYKEKLYQVQESNFHTIDVRFDGVLIKNNNTLNIL